MEGFTQDDPDIFPSGCIVAPRPSNLSTTACFNFKKHMPFAFCPNHKGVCHQLPLDIGDTLKGEDRILTTNGWMETEWRITSIDADRPLLSGRSGRFSGLLIQRGEKPVAKQARSFFNCPEQSLPPPLTGLKVLRLRRYHPLRASSGRALFPLSVMLI